VINSNIDIDKKENQIDLEDLPYNVFKLKHRDKNKPMHNDP
jgi:hypothetical protein